MYNDLLLLWWKTKTFERAMFCWLTYKRINFEWKLMFVGELSYYNIHTSQQNAAIVLFKIDEV